MDMKLKENFLHLWGKHFPGAELPITFYYTDDAARAGAADAGASAHCLADVLKRPRAGETVCLDVDAVRCSGGKRYLGFEQSLMPNFEYFLSCGIPGKVKGERYKKSPEIVREAMKQIPAFVAPARFIMFKRWDRLDEAEDPAVVIFFARPDELAGLFTLAGFDETDWNSVIAPFGAGCATIVQYPYLEKDKEHPRAVIGLFDVSVRPWVPPNVLSFAVPMNKFTRMVANMEESFLMTSSWTAIKNRL